MKYFTGAEKVPDSGRLHYLPFMLIFTANIFWSLSWIHSSEHNINPIQTTLIRAFTLLLFNSIVCKFNGFTLDLKSARDFKIMTKRNVFFTLHSFVMATAQLILPLPVVHTISCSGVLIVFILDYLLYGVSINSWQGIGIGIGFTGVLLNANGNLITSLIDPSA